LNLLDLLAKKVLSLVGSVPSDPGYIVTPVDGDQACRTQALKKVKPKRPDRPSVTDPSSGH